MLFFQKGLTLIEMLVVMVIISLLATVAVPYVEISVQRNKELELKRVLRNTRDAIDRFHNDWKAKKFSSLEPVASLNGYPVSLSILVDGVVLADSIDTKQYYLRRLPINPFSKKTNSMNEQWINRGYRDEPDNINWNQQDIYDIRPLVDKKKQALDGTDYANW